MLPPVRLGMAEDTGTPTAPRIERVRVTDKARAYHNSYFEVLGEQGYFGFALWMLLQIVSLGRTTAIYRRYRRDPASDKAWIAPLALALMQVGGTADGGYSEGGVTALESALRINPTWYNGGGETFGPGGSVIAAMKTSFILVISGGSMPST